MFSSALRWWQLAPCLFGFLSCLSAAEPDAWRFVPNDDGVLVAEGPKNVLFFQRRMKSWNGKFARANYVHPLYDLDGRELTEDFPADHRHHRGIFWAWHQTWIGDKRVGDGWALNDFSWDVRDVTMSQTRDAATLRTDVLWKSPLWLDSNGQEKPFVREETTIRISRAEADWRAIDFTIRLLALEKGVQIGGSEDEKGYGGFSPRVRLPQGVRFIGAGGEVTPENTAVDAGRWLDIVARFGDGPEESGVAILPRASGSVTAPPPRWILRNKGSMQNVVFPGRDPVVLPTDQPLVLRYRLVVHRGTTDATRIEKWSFDGESPSNDLRD